MCIKILLQNCFVACKGGASSTGLLDPPIGVQWFTAVAVTPISLRCAVRAFKGPTTLFHLCLSLSLLHKTSQVLVSHSTSVDALKILLRALQCWATISIAGSLTPCFSHAKDDVNRPKSLMVGHRCRLPTERLENLRASTSGLVPPDARCYHRRRVSPNLLLIILNPEIFKAPEPSAGFCKPLLLASNNPFPSSCCTHAQVYPHLMDLWVPWRQLEFECFGCLLPPPMKSFETQVSLNPLVTEHLQ